MKGIARHSMLVLVAVVGALLSEAGCAQQVDATFATRNMTPEIALAATRAALESCRNSGYQVAVAVVDRSGVTQSLLRDRFAGPHTPDTATNKAWTAASFKTTTLALASETQAGKAQSGIRSLPRLVAAGGGVPIEAGGSLLGAIGVSGAPGGDADEACARAGIKAIADLIEF